MASGSLKGHRFRDLGSLGVVRGGEHGGSENELLEARAKVPHPAREAAKAFGAEEVSGEYLKR